MIVKKDIKINTLWQPPGLENLETGPIVDYYSSWEG